MMKLSKKIDYNYLHENFVDINDKLIALFEYIKYVNSVNYETNRIQLAKKTMDVIMKDEEYLSKVYDPDRIGNYMSIQELEEWRLEYRMSNEELNNYIYRNVNVHTKRIDNYVLEEYKITSEENKKLLAKKVMNVVKNDEKYIAKVYDPMRMRSYEDIQTIKELCDLHGWTSEEFEAMFKRK